MSDTAHSEEPDHDSELRDAIAGILASGVVGELSGPLAELRDRVAAMLVTLESHVHDASGPEPYPWPALLELRQELADVYLLARQITRMTGELSGMMADGEGELTTVDINAQVELALGLAERHVKPDTDVFIDCGSLPPVRAVASEICLAVGKLILCCARSTAQIAGSAISIKTFCEEAEGDGPAWVIISVADNGAGGQAALDSAYKVVAPIMERMGGSFDGVAEPGRGSAFECRIPASSQESSPEPEPESEPEPWQAANEAAQSSSTSSSSSSSSSSSTSSS